MTELFNLICDDAAVFPPGNMPVADAVPAHLQHRRSIHSDLVGPFVVAAADLDALADAVASMDDPPNNDELRLAVTVPLSELSTVFAAVSGIAGARLDVLEVALANDTQPNDVVPELDRIVSASPSRLDIDQPTVFVEVPRDHRREPVLSALAGTSYNAKFRTGGVRPELYPDERELAHAILVAARLGVPFKATAGLHHAVRNTDPETGFEQHGFLNVLAATAAASAGADEPTLVGLLAERDPERVATHVRTVGTSARTLFRSFGTCSIAEPVAELTQLGLLDGLPNLIQEHG